MTLDITDLHVAFETRAGRVNALRGVNLSVSSRGDVGYRRRVRIGQERDRSGHYGLD